MRLPINEAFLLFVSVNQLLSGFGSFYFCFLCSSHKCVSPACADNVGPRDKLNRNVLIFSEGEFRMAPASGTYCDTVRTSEIKEISPAATAQAEDQTRQQAPP